MKMRLKNHLKALKQALSHKSDLAPHFEALEKELEALQDIPNETPKQQLIDQELARLGADFYLFSDGACRGNPGPGSWASIGQQNDGSMLFEDTGVEMLTTNNRMELMGAIRSLDCFISSQGDLASKVVFCTDSQYVIKGMETWVTGWKARGWKKADNKTPENVDLWQRLDELQSHFKHLRLHWVKGHNGHPQNERCDRMANEALNQAGF